MVKKINLFQKIRIPRIVITPLKTAKTSINMIPKVVISKLDLFPKINEKSPNTKNNEPLAREITKRMKKKNPKCFSNEWGN